MNFEELRNKIVYRYDGQYGVTYSIMMTKDGQNGEKDRAYIPIRFRKGVELENKTKINIKHAWLDFYLSKEEKKPVYYIFASAIEIVEGNAETIKKEEPTQDSTSFDSVKSEEIVINDDDLPF